MQRTAPPINGSAPAGRRCTVSPVKRRAPHSQRLEQKAGLGLPRRPRTTDRRQLRLPSVGFLSRFGVHLCASEGLTARRSPQGKGGGEASAHVSLQTKCLPPPLGPPPKTACSAHRPPAIKEKALSRAAVCRDGRRSVARSWHGAVTRAKTEDTFESGCIIMLDWSGGCFGRGTRCEKGAVLSP